MKKMSRRKRIMLRRFLAVAFAFMMVLGSVAVPAGEVKAAGTEYYKTILGNARFYGIVAKELHQKNHMQTNYAVLKFTNSPGSDKGGAIPNEPDLVQGKVIPFCAAEINGWVRFGQSTYYGKAPADDPNKEDSKNARYVYDTGIGQKDKIVCDTNSVALDIRETEKAATEVQKMIDNFKTQSATFKKKANIDKVVIDANIKDTNHYELNVTGMGHDIVYIDVDKDSRLYQVITKDNGLKLIKKEEQTVVFNVSGTDVKIGKFTLAVMDNANPKNQIKEMDTAADSSVGAKNEFLRDYVDEKIVWNLYNATKVDINSGAGIFLIPNEDSTTTISASSTGWLASAGIVENPNAEWHFPHKIIYEQGPGHDDGYVRPSAPPTEPETPPVDLYISKKSLTGWSEVPGASLKLYEGTGIGADGKPTGTLIDEWESTNEPHLIVGYKETIMPKGTKIAAGKSYTLYEEAAPTGYKVATRITFEFTTAGLITNVTNAAGYMADVTSPSRPGKVGGLIIMTDEADITIKDIEISKKSFGEGEEYNELPNAKLELHEYTSAGPIVEEWTSEGTPHTISGDKLNPMYRYVLVEKATPDDSKYEISSNIEFSIDDKGNIKDIISTSSDLTMQNMVKDNSNADAEKPLIVMFDKIKPVSETPDPTDPTNPTNPTNPTDPTDPGDGTVTLPDGTIVYPDGSKKLPDGTIEYPDGSKKLPDGTIVYPDGSAKLPDGTIVYLDGSKKLPDGTIVNPDGSKKLPDGSIETVTGTVVKPDGSVDYPDGSKVDQDGNFIDTDGTVYPYNPANPSNPLAEYDYVNDHVPTPDISSKDEDDKEFMQEFKKKGSNKQDQKNASRALRNAAAIKTGGDSQTLTSDTKVTLPRLGAKNTSKTSKKLNSKLKSYRKVYKKQKKQIAGWVTVNGTNIDYPVMYSGLKHNDKYLHKNIYGKEDTHGMIFASYLTTSRKISYNYVIYGHNMKDETMFGNLDNYGSPSFAKSHRYINVDTSKYNYVYEVVDVVRVSCAAGSSDPTIYTKFADIGKKKVYNKWKKQVAKCRDKNYKKPLAKYSNKDRLVILSTCEYTKDNGRLGLICKQKSCTKVK